jgi:LysM repeat protein
MRQLWTRAAVIALTAGTLAACETTSAPQYPARDGQPTGAAARPIAQLPDHPGAVPRASDQPDRHFAATQRSDPPRADPGQAAPAPSLPEPTVRRTELPPPPGLYAACARSAQPRGRHHGHRPRGVRAGQAAGARRRSPATPWTPSPAASAPRAPNWSSSTTSSRRTPALGQKIKGPASEDAQKGLCRPDRRHDVRHRQALQRHPAALADENDLKTGASIKKGQKLLLPDGYKDKGPTKTTVMQAARFEPTVLRRRRVAAPAVRSTSSPRVRPRASTSSSPIGSSGSTVTTTSLSVTGSVVSVTGPRQVYTVKSGDTLTSIAKRFDMSVKRPGRRQRSRYRQAAAPGRRRSRARRPRPRPMSPRAATR